MQSMCYSMQRCRRIDESPQLRGAASGISCQLSRSSVTPKIGPTYVSQLQGLGLERTFR